MSPDTITHDLSFVIRFVDHFSGQPVPNDLPARLDQSFQRPSIRSGGAGHRQSDGTYRFLSVPGGTKTVLWRDPFQREQSGWTSWDQDPEITLPIADPTTPMDFTLWPASNAIAHSSATGLRGKLEGLNTNRLTVRIAPAADAFDRYTRSDAASEFLFLPPGRLLANAMGSIAMKIELEQADGTPRPVTGGRFSTASAGAAFVGPNFNLTPRSVSRILFQVA